jgi:hypothetical protein
MDDLGRALERGIEECLVAILGDTGKQFARATEAHRLLNVLAAEKPSDLTYQSDLSTAYDEVGDVLGARGSLTKALQAYRVSLAIRERLAKTVRQCPPAARSLILVPQDRRHAEGARQAR